ncbi:BLUF domain-containing protein [Hymenobacter gummosus]|uniref:BLUF domain-containing protein n=1 Tax=Hymenobacter gummosus TaxID=1776032 RepID=A0A3S0HKX4_9BACT|nr:BLUF domain-containing protein [Hymenobacter gummosus]RTQ47146.1 BLUF domain-containing protein [Hymenobacter gummosus]
MHHLIYLSTPTQPLNDAELHALLTTARAKNAELDVTGMLFYGPGHFLQLLEGDEITLAALYEQIGTDVRHHSLVKLADKSIAGRSFLDWSMAFRPLDAALFDYVHGFKTLEEVDLTRTGLSRADVMLLDMLRAHLLQTPE